jgi:hypothetical protein
MLPRVSVNLKILVWFTFVGVVGACGEADGQIITTSNIEQLCASAPVLTYRKTVIYVDLAAIRNARIEWGLTILNRLELAPRERLTIVAVNPSTFEGIEVFESCFPALTVSEVEGARKSRGIWDKLVSPDPVDQQRENLQTFDARLRNALDKIIAESKSYRAGERQNILGAIAFDKNRYLDQTAFYRMIIYTDGTIKDPAADRTATGGKVPTEALAERYPASFSGAEVAVFGIDGNVDDELLQRKEQSFSAFFLGNWAHLESFAPSLPQQEHYLYPAALRMDGSFEGGGTQGSTKLALFTTKQGNIAEGWLSFDVARNTIYMPFQGEYSCVDGKCRLNATCAQSVPPQSLTPYFRKGDKIVLDGKVGGTLEGSLQADSREVFKGGNQSVSYTLKFSSQ